MTISIQKEENNFWIIVEDDGIGMSERVLTGPLLDFGTSFWTSDLVKSEFPGLRSSKHKPVGKFGIGFYSIFMIAEQVIVSSRNWNQGLIDVHQLKFSNGFTLKPILTKGEPKKFRSSISTQVKFKVKEGVLNDDLMFEVKTNRSGSKNFFVPIEKQIALICAGLDVPVFFKSLDKETIKIHESVCSEKFDKKQWLTDISFADFNCNDKTISEYIESNIDRIKPIYEENKLVGLAAINTRYDDNVQAFFSISTIGGLFNLATMREDGYFVGYLDCNPNSAKRDTGSYIASDSELEVWATEQMNYLLTLNLEPVNKYVASAALCSFKVDSSPLAQIYIEHNGKFKFQSIEQLAETSLKFGLLFPVQSDYPDNLTGHHNINISKNYVRIVSLGHGSYLSMKLENDIPQEKFSLIDCIYRKIIDKGYIPEFRKRENMSTDNFGRQVDGVILASKRR